MHTTPHNFCFLGILFKIGSRSIFLQKMLWLSHGYNISLGLVLLTNLMHMHCSWKGCSEKNFSFPLPPFPVIPCKKEAAQNLHSQNLSPDSAFREAQSQNATWCKELLLAGGAAAAVQKAISSSSHPAQTHTQAHSQKKIGRDAKILVREQGA